jgi:hypothetical protein
LTDDDTNFEARDLLGKWRAATGTYLGRLATSHPDRVERKRTAERREWVLRRGRSDGG